MNVELRKPLLSDAKRYFEILSHPEFTYFPAKPATVKEEKDFLRKLKSLQASGSQYTFAVIAHQQHVGGAGIKIKPQHPYICEIGYFIDRKYWNRGLATQAVKLLERFIRHNLQIIRIEIVAARKNVASCRVAVKSGYKKEGVMKKYLKIGDTYHDCNLYAKIKE